MFATPNLLTMRACRNTMRKPAAMTNRLPWVLVATLFVAACATQNGDDGPLVYTPQDEGADQNPDRDKDKPGDDIGGEPSTPTPPAPPPPGPNPTPYPYYGVEGNIPAALCSRNFTVHMASITPSPVGPLQAASPVTFTATISYAFTANQNLRLVVDAIDKLGNMTSFQSNAVAAAAGCSSVEVSLANFDPSPYSSLVVYTRTMSGASFGQHAATYFVADEPYFRVTATSHPLDQVLAFDAFGDAIVTVNATWNLTGGNAWDMLATGSAVSAFDETFDHPNTPTNAVTTGLFTFRFHPRSCLDRYWTETYSLWDLVTGAYINYTLQWHTLLPDVIASANDRRLYSDSAATVYGARLVNCTTTDKDVTLRSANGWLAPQAGVITVPASSAVDVTYAAIVTGKPYGLTRGAIAVHPTPGTFTTLPVSVDLVTLNPAGYALSQPAYQWLDDLGAADRTVQFSSGDDVIKTVPLPFDFTFFGTAYSDISISTNGFMTLGASTDPGCCSESKLSGRFPHTIFVNERDLWVSNGLGEIRSATLGSAPNRSFVVTYANITDYGTTNTPATYQTVLHEGSNDIVVQYQSLHSVGLAGVSQGDGLHGLFWTPVTGTAFRIHKN